MFFARIEHAGSSVIVHVVSFASGLLGNQSNTHTHNDNVIIGVMVCGNVCYCIRWGGENNQNHGPNILRTGGGGVPPASHLIIFIFRDIKVHARIVV